MSEQSHYEEAFDLIQRGRTIRGWSRPAEALQFFLRAARLAPQSEMLRHEIKATREEIQQLVAAVEQFEQGLSKTASDSQALLEVADVFIGLNRREEAIAATKCAVALDPENVEALCDLANRLNDSGQFEEAVAVCDQIIVLEPEWSFPWSFKGMALCNMERYVEAIPVLEQAITLDPDDVLGWTEKVRALSLLGRKDEARVAHKQENAARRASGVPEWMPHETEEDETEEDV